MAEEFKRLHSRLAELLSIMKGYDYVTTIPWLHAKVSFVVSRSALLCLSGSRTQRWTLNIQENDRTVENVKSAVILLRFLRHLNLLHIHTVPTET